MNFISNSQLTIGITSISFSLFILGVEMTMNIVLTYTDFVFKYHHSIDSIESKVFLNIVN